LVTDVSLSMKCKLVGACDKIDSDPSQQGIPRDCNEQGVYSSDTMKLSLAKCLDKLAVKKIFETTPDAKLD